METALIQILLADAGLGAVVGRRVWWLQRPQASALPALVLQKIATKPAYALAARVGLTGSVVQLDGWAATYTDAVAIRAAIIAACDAQNAAALTAGPNAPGLKNLFIQGDRDFYEPAGDGQPALFRASLDVAAWFLEA